MLLGADSFEIDLFWVFSCGEGENCLLIHLQNLVVSNGCTLKKKKENGAGFWSYFQSPCHAIHCLCLQQGFSYLISTFLKVEIAHSEALTP